MNEVSNNKTSREIKIQVQRRLAEAKRLEQEKIRRDREYEEEMRLQFEAEDCGENYWDETPAENY